MQICRKDKYYIQSEAGAKAADVLSVITNSLFGALIIPVALPYVGAVAASLLAIILSELGEPVIDGIIQRDFSAAYDCWTSDYSYYATLSSRTTVLGTCELEYAGKVQVVKFGEEVAYEEFHEGYTHETLTGAQNLEPVFVNEIWDLCVPAWSYPGYDSVSYIRV